VEDARAKNHFGNEDAAALYAQGRVNYHPHVVERLHHVLLPTEPLGLAVDVGCGTGLSTRALQAVARRVVGIDPSEAMMARAPRGEGLEYLRGCAERFPLADSTVDLIAVSQAFHWIEDRPAFFREVHRTLRPGGLLAVWTNALRGARGGDGSFEEWDRGEHRERYPTPPRRTQFGEAELESGHFRLVACEPYEIEVPLRREEAAAYFLSQSNALAVLDAGRETYEEAREWFLQKLEPFFRDHEGPRPFVFGGALWVVAPAR
jgi:SAM-dependent methyltransferase